MSHCLDTPGRMLAPSRVQDETCEISGFDSAVALRRLLPPVRARENCIVARSGSPNAGLATFRNWFEREATCLDWVLEQLGMPPIDTLVHEPTSTTG